jgi:hypothetical protein
MDQRQLKGAQAMTAKKRVKAPPKAASTKKAKAAPESGETAAAPQAARLPDIFPLTAEMKAWVVATFGRGIPLSALQAAHDEFLDYWRAVPGREGRKLDWMATWRNGIRRAAGRWDNPLGRHLLSREPARPRGAIEKPIATGPGGVRL